MTSGEPTLRLSIAPLPQTRRGFGIRLNATQGAQPRLLYTNGRLVLLRSLAQPSDCLIFNEHKSNVAVAVQSPNGNWIASGDDSGNCIIWSYPQMKVKNTFTVASRILDLDWDADGTRLVCAGDGGLKAKVFSWDSGNNLGEITMHSLPILAVSYRKHRPYRIATASEDLTVNLYEGPPFKFNTTYKDHSRYPNSVRFSPDGSRYVSVGSDSKIVLHDGTTGAVQKEIDALALKEQGHTGAIYDFDFSPDGERILTASADKTCRVWNLTNGQVTHTFKMGIDTLDMQVGCRWISDEYLITVSLSGAIHYLDLSNSTVKQSIHGHQTSIQALALDTHSHSQFYTSAMSGEICEWSLGADGASVQGRWLSGKGHAGKVVTGLCVISESDKRYLLSVGLDNKLRKSDLSTHTISTSGIDLGASPVAVEYASKSGLIAVIVANERLLIIKGDSILSDTQLKYIPTALCFTADQSQLIVGSKAKQVHLYALDTKSGAIKQLHVLASHDKPVTSVACSSNGKLLASTDKEASVYLHTLSVSASTAPELQNKTGWRFHQAGVNECAFNAAGTRLVTCSIDASLILWNDLSAFVGSERTRIANAHAADITQARFLDEKTLLSVGAVCIKLWNL